MTEDTKEMAKAKDGNDRGHDWNGTEHNDRKAHKKKSYPLYWK